MRFLIDKNLLDVTKQEIELLKYHAMVIPVKDNQVIIDTDAYREVCYAAVCRAYLESLDDEGDFIYVTEEESENMCVVSRLMGAIGKRALSIYGTQQQILPETGFQMLD